MRTATDPADSPGCDRQPLDDATAAFAARLQHIVGTCPVGRTRMVRALASPRCPRALERRLAVSAYVGARAFTGQLAALIRLADAPEARLMLIENLIDEEGLRIVSGQGLALRPQAVHLRWAEIFLHSLDMTVDDALAMASADGINRRLTRFAAYLAAGDWLAAMAYLMVGQEALVPATFGPIIDGLRARGHDEAGIVFFTAHLAADLEHGGQAVALMARLAGRDHRRQAAIADAVMQGAHDWWLSYGGDGATDMASRQPGWWCAMTSPS
jgi:pyrroloquinoline quinone (PQQ) biosynthesis protein C